MKLGNDDDKEEDVEFNCEDDMRNFLPYYYKETTNCTDKKDDFDLALCHYISFENVNGPTFDQFEHYQKAIKKSKVVNNNDQASTDTETIFCLSIVNKSKKLKSKKVLGNISDMSKSNSEDSSTDCDGIISSDINESVPSPKNKIPKPNVLLSDISSSSRK